jgi:hypothetical protein
MVSLAQKVILERGEDRKQTLVHVIVRDVLLQIVICSLQLKIQNQCYCKYVRVTLFLKIHFVVDNIHALRIRRLHTVMQMIPTSI